MGGKGGMGDGGKGFIQGGWKCWACKAGPFASNASGCNECGKPKLAWMGRDGSICQWDGFWYSIDEWWGFVGKGGGKGKGGACGAGTAPGSKGAAVVQGGGGNGKGMPGGGGGGMGMAGGGGGHPQDGRWMQDSGGVGHWVPFGHPAEKTMWAKGGGKGPGGKGGGKDGDDGGPRAAKGGSRKDKSFGAKYLEASRVLT